MQDDVGYLIKRISETIDKYADESFSSIGLTSTQARILTYLMEHRDTEITQKQLEVYFDVTHPTITGLIKRLESKGVVICRMSETDRRQKIITLIEPTEADKRKITSHRTQCEELMLSGFSANERKTLMKMLGRVYANTQKM